MAAGPCPESHLGQTFSPCTLTSPSHPRLMKAEDLTTPQSTALKAYPVPSLIKINPQTPFPHPRPEANRLLMQGLQTVDEQ